jgi:hypothetical protein
MSYLSTQYLNPQYKNIDAVKTSQSGTTLTDHLTIEQTLVSNGQSNFNGICTYANTTNFNSQVNINGANLTVQSVTENGNPPVGGNLVATSITTNTLTTQQGATLNSLTVETESQLQAVNMSSNLTMNSGLILPVNTPTTNNRFDCVGGFGIYDLQNDIIDNTGIAIPNLLTTGTLQQGSYMVSVTIFLYIPANTPLEGYQVNIQQLNEQNGTVYQNIPNGVCHNSTTFLSSGGALTGFNFPFTYMTPVYVAYETPLNVALTLQYESANTINVLGQYTQMFVFRIA